MKPTKSNHHGHGHRRHLTAAAIVAAALVGAYTPVMTPAFAADAATTATPDKPTRETMRERFRERMQERSKENGPARPMIDKHLTTNQVRDIVQGRLAMADNPNLKVGKVTAKEEGIVAVDIVTKTGALVETREISTRTGLPAKLEARLEERRGHGGPGMRGPGGPGGMAMRGGPGGPERGGPGRGGPERNGPEHGGPEHGGKDLALTVDQAKKLAEARLILMGNPHLKVGAVKEKDADTITIDIVAADNSLVATREIDRHNGRPKRFQG